jgi:hypothetical protein
MRPGNGSQLQRTLFAHPHARRVVDDVVAAVTRPGGPQFASLIGPAGVGKSTILDVIENRLAYLWRADLEASPDPMPVVTMVAPAASRQTYSLGTFYREALSALGDPAVRHVVGIDVIVANAGDRFRRPRPDADELSAGARARFVERRVRALLIDEANHLATHRHQRDLLLTLDSIKEFAGRRFRVVLCGAPGLRTFEEASAQLGRRIVPFEFHRYRWSVDHERQAFVDVARAMLRCIEGLDETTIEESIALSYERSLGCVGTLHDWLLQAEHEFRTNRPSWAAALAAPAPSVAKALTALEEIEAFAASRSGASRPVLQRRLGLAPSSPETSRRPVTRRRPGKRNPTRDAVGV